MSHYFYEYKIYFDDDEVERTLLKWIVDGYFGETQKIDKPTSQLTIEDQEIIQHFIDEGMLVQKKTDIDIPPSDDTQIIMGQ